MKTLELNQMESLQGGLSCEDSLGFSAGLYTVGIVLTASGAGAGFGLAILGATALFGSAVGVCGNN
ncbi:hypothetical protein C7448_10824 [Tenacibaculum gallaicum]|uniref:Uncharacterized protein n=1 Tax=Tenacibaculum gallaicum TaxID=561505 RepID=A0A3E0HIN3_9FLAO|nr:hypothetical protein [Tenacibaculum gallaicum]REH46354.1 hypothetical protein C7448_10824 [Tenacibaculum gallaicum]